MQYYVGYAAAIKDATAATSRFSFSFSIGWTEEERTMQFAGAAEAEPVDDGGGSVVRSVAGR